MARINNFRREMVDLCVVNPSAPISRVAHSAHPVDRAIGFRVTEEVGSTKKPKASKPKARDKDFALLLADDAEKNFDKMIPATKERRDRIAALLEGVELD
jgi:hypothetical protein